MGQIFGVPGEENLDLVEVLRESSIKLALTRANKRPAHPGQRVAEGGAQSAQKGSLSKGFADGFSLARPADSLVCGGFGRLRF